MTTFELPSLQPATPFVAPSPADEQAMLEARMQAGHAEGLALGRQQGADEARAELAGVIAAFERAAAELVARRDALCEVVEPAAISLALASAEQIVGAALAVNPELVLETTRGALRRLVDRDHLTILCNPDDLERFREHAPALAEELGGIGVLEIQAERRIATGGVIVQTPDGDVDARLDTRLTRLGAVVRDALQQLD
ncbi:MAG: FliH/SctL family protein [Patulibacter sp.]